MLVLVLGGDSSLGVRWLTWWVRLCGWRLRERVWEKVRDEKVFYKVN